jgi:signal transduction histidine kinase
MAAYLLASEAIRDAADRDASHAVLTTDRGDDRLVITVDDDGRDRDGQLALLVDRVGAGGGTVDIEAKRVRGELPCA